MKTKEQFEERWPVWMSDVPCGFWCPKGWTDLVWQLMENIESELDGNLAGFELHQVKEKFGGLRFYYGVTDKDKRNAISELVTVAESASWKICLTCGTNEGVTTGGSGWVSSQCGPCRAIPVTPRVPRYT